MQSFSDLISFIMGFIKLFETQNNMENSFG